MNLRTITATPCCLLLTMGAILAQAPNNATSAPPVSYSSITELNQMLTNLQQVSQSTQADLSHLRVEKWKTDSGTKRQTENNVESLQRNLQGALPGILDNLKNSPENVAFTFKVYRNLDALYDVMSSVVESAGAFGSKDEFQSLSKDLESLEDCRRAFADRVDKLANAKESEVSQLRTALQTLRAATPPKKTIVDDTSPPPAKKPVTKKKPAPKPTQPSSQTAPPTQQ